MVLCVLFLNIAFKCVFQLTAFIYVCGDVDSSGVVRDESFEVGVNLEIIRNISVLLFCLIKLHKETEHLETTLQNTNI